MNAFYHAGLRLIRPIKRCLRTKRRRNNQGLGIDSCTRRRSGSSFGVTGLLLTLPFLAVLHFQYCKWPSAKVTLHPCMCRSEGMLFHIAAVGSDLFRG